MGTTRLYPLRTTRLLSHRLWGGDRLASFLGINPGDNPEPLAESWQVAGECRVTDGEYSGTTLADLAERLGEGLLGTAAVERYGRTFPLLAKFIDAAQPLSIQVHPDDAYALTREKDTGHLGKAEAWLILQSDPAAYVVRGFVRPVKVDELREAVLDGSVKELLARQPVKPGDIVYNDPGTVHAIGADILLFEIQQASDLTYRLYDFGRKDAAGKTRELHLDKALEVARLGPAEPTRVPNRCLAPGRKLLFECEYFVVEEVDAMSAAELTVDPTSLEILTTVEGSVSVRHEGKEYEMAAGSSLTLPAAMGRYEIAGTGRAIRCYLPAT